MRWCYRRCTECCSCYMRSCDCAACDLLQQMLFGKFRSRNCPQYFGTGPSDPSPGGTRHGGSAAWISRTSVFVWPDLGKLWSATVRYPSSAYRGNPRAVECRGNPLAGGVTSFYRLERRVFFSGGLGTSRRRRVIQGHDTSSLPSEIFFFLTDFTVFVTLTIDATHVSVLPL